MNDLPFLQGNRARWRILQMLGEGDAGEVYLVESFLEKKVAILKRPRRGGFPADVLRQANQIDTEARILNALSSSRLSTPDTTVRFAELLDQSLPGNELTERYFIVVEKAPGVDLGTLLKLNRYGYQASGLHPGSFDDSTAYFLQQLCEVRAIPELIVLRILAGLFDLLEGIHRQPVHRFNGEHQGILWNDIKLDHLFWDSTRSRLTVIDWGNGQFLEEDGVSADRRYSRSDDYRQLVEVMGKFILECTPQLLAPLYWPSFLTPADASRENLAWLVEKISAMIEERVKGLSEARLQEAALIASDPPEASYLEDLVNYQRQIILHGETPDLPGAARLYARLARLMAEDGRWIDFLRTCEQLEKIPAADHKKWSVLARLYEACDREDNLPSDSFREAILAGLEEDWAACLWNICLATDKDPHPERWQSLSTLVRSMIIDPEHGVNTPFMAAVDLLQGLEEDRPWVIDRLSQAIASGNLADTEQPDRLLRLYDALIARFKNETLQKWVQPEPLPPEAGLTYSDVEAILAEMADLLPRLGINPKERLSAIYSALSQPKAQTEIVIDAWQAKGFKTAQQGLRNLLLWDPDRRRLLKIDQALQHAPLWLEDARRGPQPGERLQEYALRMEFYSREMRTRVAGAHWIDSALSLFSELRGGRRPGEVLEANPRLADIFTWLQRYQPKANLEVKTAGETALGARTDGFRPHRETGKFTREIRLGHDQAMGIGEAMDAWVPEAKGSSARVFQGFLRDSGGRFKQAAVKIMRPDKADYALPLFWEEAQILAMLEDVPGVAGMIECGYILLDGRQTIPPEDSSRDAHALTGDVVHYTPEEVDSFVDALDERVSLGWLPYLAVEKLDQEESLLLACDEGYTRGKVLPVEIGLEIAAKICDILEIAHSRDIVYRDHKILHYYWNQRQRKVCMIDWNVAKWHPQGVSEEEIRLDLVQFGARTLHHILTGRPAPGALPVGPNRPQDIEMAPQRYSPVWTYDDTQRMPGEVMDLLARVLAGSYDSAARVREDLLLQIPY